MERIKQLRYINIAAMTLVAGFNLVDGIHHHTEVVRLLLFTVPFVAVAVALFFIKTYKINAVVYAISGLLVAATGGTGNFSGAIFLIFSFYIFNTAVTNWILLFLCAGVLTVKYLFAGYTIPDMLNQIVAYAFTFGIYFVLMHPRGKVAGLDEDEEEIIQCMSEGMRVKEIADQMNLTANAIYKRQRKLREKYKCGSNAELIGKLRLKSAGDIKM